MYKPLKITIYFACIVIIIISSSFAVFLRRMPVLAGYDHSNAEVSLAIELLENEYTEIESDRTNSDYRSIIENDFNCHLYFYKEVDLPEGVDGQTIPMFRIIKIDSDAKGFFYCSTFAHEMIHLTGYIQQESYVNFRTFIYLIEHEDPEFHNFGVQMGIYSLKGMYPSQYDCNGDIINYVLKNLNSSDLV